MSELQDETQSKHLDAKNNQARQTIESFASFLDAEIEYLRSEFERPGWTKWALLGGIASMIWLMLERVEQGVFDLGNIGLLVVLFSLLFDAFRGLSALIQSRQTDFDRLGRFVLTNRLFHSSRVRMLLEILRSVAVIVITNLVRDRVFGPYSSLVYATYGVLTVIFIGGFVVTYFPYPIPSESFESRGTCLFNLLIFVVGTMLAVGYLISALRSPVSVSPNDIRLAALFAVLYYLLYTLTGLSLSTPILGALVAIRRQLALGKTDLNTAIRETDIALTGLKVSDVLQDKVAEMLDLSSRFRSEILQASRKLEAMRGSIQGLAEKGDKETEFAIIEALLQSTVSHIDNGSKITIEASRNLESLYRRMALIIRVSQSSKTAIQEIANKRKLALEEDQRELAELKKKSQALAQFAEEILSSIEDEGIKQKAAQVLGK